ncbi:MAG: histidinol-phosphate transaminase [Gemmatimonadetes bacterium]|nr:histidinol-phosphate transaminase [Gemmatimonadota bacterium]
MTGTLSAPDVAGALALIKPSVRAQAAYTLEAPVTARKLNQNEAPEDVPADLKRAILERAAAAPWHRYPLFFPQHLAERVAARHGWVAEGVLVGNGSNEVIQAALTVSVAEGDVVVAPEPTFSLYKLLTGVLGGHYLPVPLGPGFRYDVDALVARARGERAKVVVLCSPNNPTGSALPEGAVERLVRETDALVFVDEAYQEFGGPTAVELARREPRVVVLRTFSKAMGMAGLRFGYALAHPEVAREIAKAKLPYNVNAITLAAAEVALEQHERFEARVRHIVAERERLAPRLAALRGVEVFPSQANFLLLRFHEVSPQAVFTRLVEEAGILVRDVSRGPGLAGCLRVSIGTPADNDAVLAALVKILG